MHWWELDPQRLPPPLRALAAKEIHLWIGAWLLDRARKIPTPTPHGTRHLLFAICDHYEPLHGGATHSVGVSRVNAWRTRYPEIARAFRDATGRPPRHTFFFPGEEYDPSFIEPLAELSAMGLSEMEVHLHHDGDTREGLRRSLERTLNDLDRHGVIAKKDGRPRWAFIHGNWSLANGRRDGRWCGVDDELELLYELGCYADFTFPSAPDACQPNVVNAIYYPRGDVRLRRAYEIAEKVRVGMHRKDRVLLIQGPLALARRPYSNRVRIESASLSASDPPTAHRLKTWIDQRVSVEGRPEWIFIKLHNHGAPEIHANVMLGEPIKAFHRALAQFNDGVAWQLHYVTAREMYNVVRAAMDGHSGSPADYFDYEIPPPSSTLPRPSVARAV